MVYLYLPREHIFISYLSLLTFLVFSYCVRPVSLSHTTSLTCFFEWEITIYQKWAMLHPIQYISNLYIPVHLSIPTIITTTSATIYLRREVAKHFHYRFLMMMKMIIKMIHSLKRCTNHVKRPSPSVGHLLGLAFLMI